MLTDHSLNRVDAVDFSAQRSWLDRSACICLNARNGKCTQTYTQGRLLASDTCSGIDPLCSDALRDNQALHDTLNSVKSPENVKLLKLQSGSRELQSIFYYYFFFLFLIITISVKSALSVRKERPEKSMWNLSVWSHAILWWSKSTASHLCFRNKKEMHECIFLWALL